MLILILILIQDRACSALPDDDPFAHTERTAHIAKSVSAMFKMEPITASTVLLQYGAGWAPGLFVAI
jgi:hypothetical protein